MNTTKTRPGRLAFSFFALLCLTILGGAQAASTGQTAGPSPGRTPGVSPGKTNVGKAPTVLHVLDESSQYFSGCFPAPPFPCGGPLAWYPDFGGSFGLTVIGQDPRGFAVYAISELALSAGAGNGSVEIVGSGLYRRQFGDDAQQEMLLFVTVNGAPTMFHSGVVPVPDGDNAIDIDVTINDLQNYDTLMQIVANPGS